MLPNELRETFRTSLLGTSAEPYFDRLMTLVRPAVSLTACEASPYDDVVSRMGGLPDAPPNWDWPIGPEGPLRFLAQVWLDELEGLPAAPLLPRIGVLSFFFGPELYGPSRKNDYQIARVFYFPRDNLRPVQAPPDTVIHPNSDLFPEEFWDMPIDEDHFATEPFYRDIPEEQRNKIACDLINAGEVSDAMQLFGYPSRAQGGFLQLECEGYTRGYDYETMFTAEPALRKSAYQWELLAQFSLSRREVWPDGNDGYLHYWIHKSDLLEQDFSQICYTWERS